MEINRSILEYNSDIFCEMLLPYMAAKYYNNYFQYINKYFPVSYFMLNILAFSSIFILKISLGISAINCD